MSVNIFQNNALKKIAGNYVIDSSLSTTSKNAVQNKVITSAINGINSKVGTGTLDVGSDCVSGINTLNTQLTNVGSTDVLLASQQLTGGMTYNLSNNITNYRFIEFIFYSPEISNDVCLESELFTSNIVSSSYVSNKFAFTYEPVPSVKIDVQFGCTAANKLGVAVVSSNNPNYTIGCSVFGVK